MLRALGSAVRNHASFALPLPAQTRSSATAAWIVATPKHKPELIMWLVMYYFLLPPVGAVWFAFYWFRRRREKGKTEKPPAPTEPLELEAADPEKSKRWRKVVLAALLNFPVLPYALLLVIKTPRFLAEEKYAWDTSEWMLLALGVCGLALLGYLVLQIIFMKRSPQPRLTISRGRVIAGEPINIVWELTGSIQTLKRLHIYLEACEAVERAYEDYYIEYIVLTTIDLVETNNPAAMKHGTATLHVSMAELNACQARRNEVVWSLRVRGKPRHFWPEIDATFPVTVAAC